MLGSEIGNTFVIQFFRLHVYYGHLNHRYLEYMLQFVQCIAFSNCRNLL